MIYVPTIDRDTCYYYFDNNTIVQLPNNYEINQEYNTQFIAVDNHYQTYFKKIFIADNVNCLDHNILSDDYIYRSDIVSILFYFIFLCFLIIYIPYRLASRFWKWLR